MNNTIPGVMSLLLFCVLVCLAVLFTGCSAGKHHSGPGVDIGTGKPDRPADTKYREIEPTQRPYRIAGKRYHPLATAKGYEETGRASWYGKKFHGRKTSNGETYDMYAMTAAHKTLPMNTWVRVDNLDNGRQTTVRINDRGPFVDGRIIDLSCTAARQIEMVDAGTARVKVTALGKASAWSPKDNTPVNFTPVDYWRGNFTVQVGAFTVRRNADQYRVRLSKHYLNAHIVPCEDDRGQFFRVRIGRFNNLNDAVAFSQKLMEKEGFQRAFAVAE